MDGRSTRWADHKAQRRRAVLDAALRAIDAEGASVGVAQIAEHAGLPRSVVYRLFQERGDLDEQVRAHIVDELMARMNPVLVPEGTAAQSIDRAVNTYVRWITEHPHQHQFLGVGSKSRPARGSKMVTGTKTATALHISEIFGAMLRAFGKDATLAESVSFGLIGLVDGAVNRWLSNRQRPLDAEQLALFLSRSIWYVLDGNLRALGVEFDPHAPLGDLAPVSR